MNKHEEILHTAISVAWNNTYKNDPLMFQRLICYWNNAPTKQYGNKMKIMGAKEGVADWQWLDDKGVIWIELKTLTGKQGIEQKKFQLLCESLGHRYIVCRSYTQLWSIIGVNIPNVDMSKSPFNKLAELGLY